MQRTQQTEAPRLTRQIIFRVTEDDFRRLEALAAKTGLSVNELARRMAQRGSRRLVIQVAHRHDPAFITQIHRVGLNLNQLVKNAHIFGRMPDRVTRLCERIELLVQSAVDERIGE